MGLLDKVKSLFQNDRLDVSARFELERQSISGTMSKFRVAHEIATGQKVGIKFLDEEKSEYFESRFRGLKKPSEGEIALSIQHPRVVETHEHGLTTTGQKYIVMQYLEGPGLHIVIQNRDSQLEGKRLALIRQMAEAVEAVHSAGYIHRDICPRNFICARDLSSLTLIDFGLTLPDKKDFRQPGNRTGTPLYMAPEIIRRRWTDKRVDIFALGITAYRVCAFKHPWGGADTTGMAALAHDTKKPAALLELAPQLNKTLAEAIEQCMSPAANDRPSSAAEFLRNISRVKDEVEPV
ncbi:MAG: serine/threonine protein kinase [Planctomycetes bacterium]|nr:serine/threonine protein kinase [Planctomycetota bacterium]